MIKFTPEMLRKLADDIERNHKYHNMCNYVELSTKHHVNGREYAEFEQPCMYAECFSTFYRFDE